jgi:thioredoxin reductase/Fe-S-cluster-containing hydrogenase component 2
MLLRYMRWLHTGWPAGTLERLPEVREDGTTVVPGLRVVGDLTGIPLLKFAADSGARAVHAIVEELRSGKKEPSVHDLAIVGGGVAGISAAIEARKAGLDFVVFEANQTLSTLVNFPKAKPIYTYPTDMTPSGTLQFTAQVKEDLVREVEEQRAKFQVEPVLARIDKIRRGEGCLEVVHAESEKVTRARRVIIAIGRSGNFRRLEVPGEDKDKVFNRLHDPRVFTGKKALVVGGGDSALEAAVALALAGAKVTLSYRKDEFTRAKPENVDAVHALVKNPAAKVAVEEPSSERITTAFSRQMMEKEIEKGALELRMGTRVVEIEDPKVTLENVRTKERATIENDVVFPAIGREPPLDFFRRSGVPIRGEWRPASVAAFLLFGALCFLLYMWKSGGELTQLFQRHGWFPFSVPHFVTGDGPLARTLKVTLGQPGFYYSLAYTIAVFAFGVARIRRRKTIYTTVQTLSLVSFQVLPLFLLPYVILPTLGYAGAFDSGVLGKIADQLFPQCNYDYGREYWRAFGFILAWPLFIWNVFTSQPMTAWLAISCIQTFVIIPAIVWRWGKGAYCGWICSCGALAETLGDAHRQKMPHGPAWNRVNMVGQGILAIALLMFVVRVVVWVHPTAAGEHFFDVLLKEHAVSYKYVVDFFLAGVMGLGCYFWLSGRVWCRFACPLAALMHIYARFSVFRIFAEKSKCISCNVCTSVCHQGIDIMSFANKGLPMRDPECVRCSACVQSCPTGTLTFGRDTSKGPVFDLLSASRVQAMEKKLHTIRRNGLLG